MKRINHRRTGFTLVELMLAMAFVSGLLLGVAFLTIQVTNIYTKGVTLTAVNQAGQTISRELQSSLNTANTTTVRSVILPEGGRLCTGSVSYAWNYGSTIKNTVTVYNKYSPDNSKDIRFIKIKDPSGLYCAAGNLSLPIPRADAVDLITSSDRTVVIHKLSFTVADLIESGQKIYHFSIRVGTNENNQFISSTSPCKTPAEANSGPLANQPGVGDDFCAVNTFDFTARSGNNLSAGSPE